jgi:hypothetical protein
LLAEELECVPAFEQGFSDGLHLLRND